MSRFVNGAVIGVVSFIALVSAFWYTADIDRGDRVSFRGLESRWGSVDAETSQIRFGLTFHNPHQAQVELVRLQQELLVNGAQVDVEQRNVSLRLPAQSNRTIEVTTEFPTSFLVAWLESHVRQGEETRVVVRGTATFMVLQRPIEVPYEWEDVWTTSLAQSIPDSVGNCASLLEDPCIEAASLTWDASTPPSMHVRLSLKNANDSAVWLRNWTSRVMLHGVAVATADVVPGPIELAPQASLDLELTFRFDSRALSSWWPRHVSSCELSPAATTVRFEREQAMPSSADANGTDSAAEPAGESLIVEERQWTLPGQAMTTGFVCTRT